MKIDFSAFLGLLPYLLLGMMGIFVVVLVILVPLAGFRRLPELLFQGPNLWQHTVCPLLSIISFVFFEKEKILKFKGT